MEKAYYANTRFFNLTYVLISLAILIFGIWQAGFIVFFLYILGILIFLSVFSFFVMNFYPEHLFSGILFEIKQKIKSSGQEKFIIKLSDSYLKTNRHRFPYTEIKTYYSPRGGSEPYLILHNGNRVDLDISWLKKEDRDEVDTFLNNIINA